MGDGGQIKNTLSPGLFMNTCTRFTRVMQAPKHLGMAGIEVVRVMSHPQTKTGSVDQLCPQGHELESVREMLDSQVQEVV